MFSYSLTYFDVYEKSANYPTSLFAIISKVTKGDTQAILLNLFTDCINSNPQANLNSQDKDGNTLIHIALTRECINTVSIPHEKKVKIDIANKEGKTAIDIALDVCISDHVQSSNEQQTLLSALMTMNSVNDEGSYI